MKILKILNFWDCLKMAFYLSQMMLNIQRAILYFSIKNRITPIIITIGIKSNPAIVFL